MFNNSTLGYSLGDIAAVTGGNNRNDGVFGNDAWWIIILLLCGWGNGGFGGGTGTTREEIAYGFDINGLENGVRGIQQGLCDGFYAMNTGMLNGFAGVNEAITQSTITDMQNVFGLQTAITDATYTLGGQINALAAGNAAASSEIKGAIAHGFGDLNYNLASQSCETRRAIADSTRDIIDSNNAGVRAILDFITQDKIAALTAENQSLKLAASQAVQNNYLISALKDPCPVPAYVVPNPNCCYNPVG